ncbi:MAG: PLDc N-terminal domain-containing protein [Candidatus Omnitrophica bacterium]|nr:PLDc N-terminal domain-containing protein [Candidatus Omnitrophota bacterium]
MGMVGIGMLLVGLLILGAAGLVIFSVVFWLLMIIDCAKREFKNPNDKVIWILIVILLQLLGATIYWAVIKKPGDPSAPTSRPSS